MRRAKEAELTILYEDKDILVCVKPPGIATETKHAGQQDLVSLLLNYRSRKGEEPYIGLVHRLDQPVEGILVFGKSKSSTARLSRQLLEGGFSKIYLAVAKGSLPQKSGRLVDYLKKDGRRNISCVTTAQDKQAKRAELEYEVLKEKEGPQGLLLVKIHLLTGRHHQIRAQLAHAGAPLAGDRKYGQAEGPGENIALCACELEFSHPFTKEKMHFQIQPSQEQFHFK